MRATQYGKRNYFVVIGDPILWLLIAVGNKEFVQ